MESLKKTIFLTIILSITAVVFYSIIDAYALPLPQLGQCEYFGAFHSKDGKITDLEPYGEWYFMGDVQVEWCDPET